MHFENKKTGKIGEDLAARYLQDKGYTIIKRSWGNKWGEIDIIAKVECTRRGLVHSDFGYFLSWSKASEDFIPWLIWALNSSASTYLPLLSGISTFQLLHPLPLSTD